MIYMIFINYNWKIVMMLSLKIKESQRFIYKLVYYFEFYTFDYFLCN